MGNPVVTSSGKPKIKPASGLSVREGGLDHSLGFLGESLSFVPLGPVRSELYSAALALEDGDAAVLAAFRQLQDAASKHRAFQNTREDSVIDGVQRAVINHLWPDTGDEETKFKTELAAPLLNIVNTIDQSRRVKLYDTGGRVLEFTVFVAELKESKAHVLDGMPQAYLAGATAALQLRRNGIVLEWCVVPVLVNTGISELHGSVYLLDPSKPVFVATSKVFDLLSSADALLAAKHRVASQRFAGRVVGQLRRLSAANVR